MSEDLKNQTLLCEKCPRRCKIDRSKCVGACGVTDDITVAKVMLHMWEEPCISGERGSGAVFFSGCPLGCVFCQNKEISHTGYGKAVDIATLADIFTSLERDGAHNINLVSPTQFSDKIREAIDIAKPKIPVVYNTGGYELASEIEKLRTYVDIFLTDIKYFSPELSKEYSKAPDYFEHAISALEKMVELQPRCVLDKNGIMQKGVILRHLVMPGARKDSMRILKEVKERIDISSVKLSLMSQYTPDFCDEKYKKIKRRITSFEYDSVVEYALSLGYEEGYIQEDSSATALFTPRFH
ncbi:MAG: radical SAM protein [Clostridia bacterium]|nr:radical SAM protein [Clostridia bacterium]